MTATDLADAHALSQVVHPGYPEDRAIFTERLRLYPAGCFALSGETEIAGYALSHPFAKNSAPALNSLLGTLPEPCDIYYIHDIAILPQARKGGAGAAIVARLRAQARTAGFDAIGLVAVNDSAPFWERQGFVAQNVAGLAEKLASYGRNACYMRGAI